MKMMTCTIQVSGYDYGDNPLMMTLWPIQETMEAKTAVMEVIEAQAAQQTPYPRQGEISSQAYC